METSTLPHLTPSRTTLLDRRAASPPPQEGESSDPTGVNDLPPPCCHPPPQESCSKPTPLPDPRPHRPPPHYPISPTPTHTSPTRQLPPPPPIPCTSHLNHFANHLNALHADEASVRMIMGQSNKPARIEIRRPAPSLMVIFAALLRLQGYCCLCHCILHCCHHKTCHVNGVCCCVC